MEDFDERNASSSIIKVFVASLQEISSALARESPSKFSGIIVSDDAVVNLNERSRDILRLNNPLICEIETLSQTTDGPSSPCSHLQGE